MHRHSTVVQVSLALMLGWSVVLILGLVLGVSGVAWATLAEQYHVVDLGPSHVGAIAKDGTLVVGYRQAAGQQQQAFLLYPVVVPLGFLPEGNFSFLNGAAGGLGVGLSSKGFLGLHTHAVIAEPDDQGGYRLRDLGTLGGEDLFSSATSINRAGKICGFGDSADLQRIVPLCFDTPTSPAREFPLLGGDNGFIEALNEAGDGVGDSDTEDGDTHAALWPVPEGGVRDLQTLAEATFSLAFDVNDDRRVCGTVAVPPFGLQAFTWTRDTGMVVLPPLEGDTNGGCFGVNDAGDSVGQSVLPDRTGPGPDLHAAAVAWEGSTGPAIDLNTRLYPPDSVGWQVRTAQGISNGGVIPCEGTLNGEARACLLIPVGVEVVVVTPPPEEPEPMPEPPRRKHPHGKRNKQQCRQDAEERLFTSAKRLR